MKGRIINTDGGTIVGMQLFQRKVVRTEYRRWRKASHPFAIVLDCLCGVICAIGIVAMFRGMHDAELILPLLLIVVIVTELYCRRQYNKQAPSELKLE
jgi:hypothetical protein